MSPGFAIVYEMQSTGLDLEAPQGCRVIRAVLKQGATPVTDAADVIAMTEPILGRGIRVASAEEAAQPPLEPSDILPDGERTRLMALLGPRPVSIDDLVRCSNTSATTVRSVLLEPEIAGRLERHGAGLVSLR
jgi:DNA processing protein